MKVAKMYKIKYLLYKHCGYLQLLASVTQKDVQQLEKAQRKATQMIQGTEQLPYEQSLSLRFFNLGE